MTRFRLQSLQVRLAVRLAILYIVATAIAAAVLIYQAYDTANSLSERELSLRAEDLARAVSRDDAGNAQLTLPPTLASAYATSEDDIFTVRDASGRLLGASPAEFGVQVSKWPLAKDDPTYFHLTNLGTSDYYGLSVELTSTAGPVSVSVARAAGANALVSSLLREFVFDVAWVSPLLMVATLAIGVLVVRSGLKPVRDISDMAARIGPDATSVRLTNKNLPAEIKPLVDAINRALDRLERGFAVQRQFTANAAHELRTPLAIVTGALDSMQGNGEVAKLRVDVARMNRLVEQLLRVARLDSVALDFDSVDLNEVASAVVEMIAPWVIVQGPTVAFVGTDGPVLVEANGHAIADAIRNLVENGVLHSAIGGEVVVSVHQDARVTVADQGCGVPVADREHIFDRFWRGKGPKAEGAGLGLAIVQETMNAHGGEVKVSDNPGGGAVFTLVFPQQEAAHPYRQTARANRQRVTTS
jgi:two-component system, OmpR family, sensor histidine kinase TctE